MDPVIAQAAIDDVVPTTFPSEKLDILTQETSDIDHSTGEGPWQGKRRLKIGLGQTVQSLSAAIATCHQDSVIADDAIDTATTRDPVVAPATDQVVVLPVTEQHIVALHSVDEVVT